MSKRPGTTKVTTVVQKPLTRVIKKQTFNARKRNPRASLPRAILPRCIHDYCCTLSNPFMHGPTKLGWGDTSGNALLGTSVIRQDINASNTNDTFIMLSINNSYLTTSAQSASLAYNPLQVNYIGQGNTFATANRLGYALVNQPQLLATAKSVRVISAGIKIQPYLKMSDAPFSMFVANIEDYGSSPESGVLFSSLFGAPTTKKLIMGYNSKTCACWRPTDPSCFEYSPQLGTAPQTTDSQGTNIMFGISGPAQSVSMSVEVIIHYEYFPTFSGLTTTSFTPPSTAPTPSSFGSPDQVIAAGRAAGYNLGTSQGDNITTGTTNPGIIRGAIDDSLGAANSVVSAITKLNPPIRPRIGGNRGVGSQTYGDLVNLAAQGLLQP
jgi:hypothetical protein